MSNLYAAASSNAIMREELLKAFPELEEDAVALKDTLDGLSSFSDVVRTCVGMMHDDEMLIEGINLHIEEVKARRDRLQLRAEKMRAAIGQAMERAGERKITLPECTVSLATVPGKVVVIDEAVIPADYFVVPEPVPRLDKRLVAQTIKDGTEVPGCTLSNGGLTVKVRRT